MLVETLILLASALAPGTTPAVVTTPAALLAHAPTAAYRAEDRSVDNWRTQAALGLDLSPVDALAQAFGFGPAEPPRCIKLNNYWCVKRAGWSGEIAHDADGHVAFASAEEGAAVAALLLRRYYVDFKRHTAREIVTRWAPAQCSPMARVAHPGATASRIGLARMLPQRAVRMGLAPRGLQNTLRARWLSAHGRGGFGGAGVAHGRAGALDLMPAPSIAAGMGEAPRRGRRAEPPPGDDVDVGVTASTQTPSFAPLPALGPMPDCSGELVRIANYAAHLAEGVAKNADTDLALFAADGMPTPNLARAMANMAAVEIGPARPREALIAIAVSQLRQLLTDPEQSLR
jgi:hypothetical protein